MELTPLKIHRQARAQSPATGGGSDGRRRRLPLVGVTLLALLGGAVWVFWNPIGEMLDRFRLIEVQTTRVEKGTPVAIGAVRGTAANGYVVAGRRAALSADTPGRVVEILVKEGSVVKQGDVVARLYSDEYAAALRRAEAELGVSQASAQRAGEEVRSAESDIVRLEDIVRAAAARVDGAQAALTLADAELERANRLTVDRIATQRERDQATEVHALADATLRANRADLDAARSAVAVSRAQLEVARSGAAVAAAQVQVASAARDLARATLDKTEVHAPFDGIVVLKDAEVGEVVSPNSTGGANARGAICTMVDFASLEVQVDVPETSLQAVTVGAKASIFLDAYPARPYPGRVARIWPTANRQKATIEVRVSFDDRDELLRPEMGARVVFLSAGEAAPAVDGAATPELLVPESALLRIAGEDGVFVVERDRVRFQRVRLDGRSSGRVAISAGLAEGDTIILDPPARLEDGSRVRVGKK